MALDRVFSTPTMIIDQSRYEELIRTELKCEQYKAEFERKADSNIINVAQELENLLRKITKGDN